MNLEKIGKFIAQLRKEQDIRKTDIRNELQKHGNYKIEFESYSGNYVYGSYLDSGSYNILLKTVGLWKYNIDNEQLEYYNYTGNDRIWSYFINDYDIYYISLSELEKTSTYKWKLIKSNLNFTNKVEIDSGELYNPSNAPFFIKDDISNKIILYAVYDELEVSEELKLLKYKTKYNISIFKDGKFNILVEEFGDHINKTGTFAYNALTNLNFFDNKIVYCNVSYYDKETIKLLDLESKKEIILYENNDLDNWNLSGTKINKGHYLMNFNSKSSSETTKLISLTEKEDKINVIYSKGYKILGATNNNFVIYSDEAFTLFSGTSFTKRLDLNNGFSANYLSNHSNKLIMQGKDSEIYIIYIK